MNFLMETDGSPAGSLSVTDWKKIGKGFVIAVVGAVIASAATLMPQVDEILRNSHPVYGFILAAGAAAGFNFLRKMWTDTQG